MAASLVPTRTDGPVVAGRVTVLSCPPAFCPHAEFVLAANLGIPVGLRWSPQQARPGTLRASLDFRAAAGVAGRLATGLRGLGPVVFEAEEQPSPGSDGERYCYTPELGLHRASVCAGGDVVLTSSQLHDALRRTADPAASGAASGATAAVTGPGVAASLLAARLAELLGDAWDEALEPLRAAADGHPVTTLRRTG